MRQLVPFLLATLVASCQTTPPPATVSGSPHYHIQRDGIAFVATPTVHTVRFSWRDGDDRCTAIRAGLWECLPLTAMTMAPVPEPPRLAAECYRNGQPVACTMWHKQVKNEMQVTHITRIDDCVAISPGRHAGPGRLACPDVDDGRPIAMAYRKDEDHWRHMGPFMWRISHD